jgi:AcrR family transcriptional regulator
VPARSRNLDPFGSPAPTRQPADELGPRAQRTIERILEAARQVFTTRGYAGATIDEIARTAHVSRASFYTYFPSKREVLFSVGASGMRETDAIIASLPDRPRTRAGMSAFVIDYLAFLDVHGSFSQIWSQAAHEDEEIRTAGMRRHLKLCRQFGEQLGAWAGRTVDEPALLGLTAWSMLEQLWTYSQRYFDRMERAAVIDELASSLWTLARARR